MPRIRIPYTPQFSFYEDQPSGIFMTQPDGDPMNVAQLSTDANGNTVGIVGPDRTYPIEKPPGQPTRPQNVVTIGPSISNYGFWNVASASKQGYPALSELAWALQHFGPGIIQKKIGGAVAGKTDDFGNFGWSGKRCDEITAELLLTWIPQLQAANYVPDVIVLTGVLTNDLYLSGAVATAEQIKARLDDLLRTLSLHFPSAKIVCTTPHLRNDSAPLANASYLASFDYARNYILSLENGTNFAAVDISGLSYASTKYAPLSGYTYGVTQGTLSSPTADAGVHPNITACSINGRAIAAAFRRLTVPGSLRIPTLKSTNLTLSGSVALSGTGNSGTAPTGAVQATTLVGATCVGAAANPGPWQVTLTADVQTPVGSALLENGQFTLRLNTTATLPLAATNVQMWAKVEIVSGAENIAALAGVMTVAGGLLGVWSNYADQYARQAEYRNGDIVYLMTPEGMAAGAATNMYHDVFVRLYKPNAPVVLKIHESGWRETETRVPLSLGASPAVYTNTSKRPQQAVISGGTVSLIEVSRDNVTFDATGVTAGVFMLQPNDRLRVTYTAIPTVAVAYPQ